MFFRTIIAIIFISVTTLCSSNADLEHKEYIGHYTLISGSIRSNSLNTQILSHISEHLRSKKILYKKVKLSNYPVSWYDGIYGNQNSKIMESFCSAIQGSKAIIISTPEYGKSIPGFFKNLLDWVSLSDLKCFTTKPIFLISLSKNRSEGAFALNDLSKIMLSLGGYLYNENFTLSNFSVKKHGILKLPLREHQDLIKKISAFNEYVNKLSTYNESNNQPK
jgi:chromate reductase